MRCLIKKLIYERYDLHAKLQYTRDNVYKRPIVVAIKFLEV